MPELNYNLSAGFDPNSLVNLQIDTFERMNRLEQGLNIPKYQSIPIPDYKPFIPKDIAGDTIITRKDSRLPTLDEALDSPDPKIRQRAKNIVSQQALKNPVTYGVGTTQTVPYTQGQNKFTRDSFFKGERNTMYGYNPYVSMAENENFNHDNVWNSYSTFGKAWRGTGLFAGRALSKAVTGIVGMVGDLGAIAWNGLQELGDTMNINDGTKNNFWNDVSNNWLSRKMEEADKHVQDQWFPVYKALNYDDKGVWNKLMDPYTWTTSFADGAGFLLQFAAPGIMLGKLGQAGRLANSIGKLEEALVAAEGAGDTVKAAKLTQTIAQAKNASAFTKAMGYDISGIGGKFSEFLTGSNNVGGISAHIFNTGMEAVAETKEGFNTTVRELMDKGVSKEKAIEIAGENAPAQFWINTAILSISNAFENKFLQKLAGNRELDAIKKLAPNTLLEAEEATTKVGKFFQNNAWGNRISFYGKNAAKASFFEGFWEENAQTAAGRYARGEYDRQGDDGGSHEKVNGNFLQQLWKQTKDAIKGNDREAADSIMAGAVIGILGTGVFSKLAGQREAITDSNGTVIKPKTNIFSSSERRDEIRQNAYKVAKFINTKDAWLSIKAFDSDVTNPDGTENAEKVKEKTEEIRTKIDKINSVAAKSFSTQDITDPYRREKLQHQIFADYVKAHILNETGDALVERLKDWQTKSPQELEMYGVTDEVAKDSQKWAAIAETLVDTYKDAEDIKYAAPSNTPVVEYQQNTNAIRSLIFDYTAFRNMNQDLSREYQDNMDKANPFSDHIQLQDYNQDHVKLMKLKQKLEHENLDPLERELVQTQIDKLEKIQKEREGTITSDALNRKSNEGLYFPSDVDKIKEAERISKYDNYFKNLNDKVDSDIEAEKYDQLVKEYSDPDKGYAKFTNTVNFWNNVYNKPIDGQIAQEEKTQVAKTADTIKKEIADLENQIENATTQEEKDAIENQVEDLKDQLDTLQTDIDTNDADITTDDDITDTPPPPTEPQYGVSEYAEQSLAYETPFKTYGKETIDAKNEAGERNKEKEIALEHGYDHDLTIFARSFQTNLVKFGNTYDTFIIKDNLDLMKQRLSKVQLENFDEGKYTPGAIVVFKEKGKVDYATFKNGKIIAFSYNKTAFEWDYDERVKIHSDRKNKTIAQTQAFFREQQSILEAAREKVINENSVIPIKVLSGSMGLLPRTFAAPALKRFEGFYDTNNPITIVKPENVNEIPGAAPGQAFMNIPDSKTVSGKKEYIAVYTTTIAKGEANSLQEKIYSSLQGIQYATFKTKKEASDVIKNYLYNFFYISDVNKFNIKEVAGGFKIVYQDAKGEHINWLTTPQLKISDKLYNTEEGFSIFEKQGTTFQPTERVSKEQYRDFIHNQLITRRKVVVQNVKNKGERLYTAPVNAYLNLSVINETDVKAGEATQTTEEEVIQPMKDMRSEESQDQRVRQSQIADIERRREASKKTFTESQASGGLGIEVSWRYIDSNGKEEKYSTTGRKNAIDELNRVYDRELAALDLKEQKVIDAFQGKTFVQLKPWTDVLQNVDKSLEDKRAALKEISDQMLATTTSETVGVELGKELGNLIDELGYPAPVENEALTEITQVEAPVETDLGILGNLKRELHFIEQQLETQKSDALIKILTVNADRIKAQITLLEKPAETMTPIEKLRKTANESIGADPTSTSIVPHLFENQKFLIDFDNDAVEGYFEDTGKEFADDFFESFPNTVFHKEQLNNNNKSYYFLKHIRLGKFVTFDENMRFYKTEELPQAILDSKEFKNIENCN